MNAEQRYVVRFGSGSLHGGSETARVGVAGIVGDSTNDRSGAEAEGRAAGWDTDDTGYAAVVASGRVAKADDSIGDASQYVCRAVTGAPKVFPAWRSGDPFLGQTKNKAADAPTKG